VFQLPRLFAFLLFIGVLATTMRLVRDIPLAFASDQVRLYQSLDDIEDQFRSESLLRPTYFPRQLAWPAEEIWAGRAPQMSVLLHFTAANSDEIVLAIAYAASADGLLGSRIEPQRVVDTSEVDLRDGPAELLLGQCENRSVCNQIRWHTASHSITVTGRMPAQELERIARGVR